MKDKQKSLRLALTTGASVLLSVFIVFVVVNAQSSLTPTSLEVKGTATIEGGTAINTNGAPAGLVIPAGNVGIGPAFASAPPTNRLDVDGTVRATTFSGGASGLTGNVSQWTNDSGYTTGPHAVNTDYCGGGTCGAPLTVPGTINATALVWGNGSGLYSDQGGSIILGGGNSNNETPFIDFYYGDSLPGRTGRIIASSQGELQFDAFGFRFSTGAMTIHINTQFSQRLCHSGGNVAVGDVVLGDCVTFNADIAEFYGIEDNTIEAGDVVSFLDTPKNDGEKFYVEKSSSRYQSNIMGVISTDPYDVFGEVFSESEEKRPLTLIGRVPVKVTTENGPIKAGDRLTPSSLPGHAMRATEAGMIIGMALESFDGFERDTGKVMVFIDLGHWTP